MKKGKLPIIGKTDRSNVTDNVPGPNYTIPAPPPPKPKNEAPKTEPKK